QGWPKGDFNPNVFAQAAQDVIDVVLVNFKVIRQAVVVKKVLGDPSSLRLPVQPQAPRTVVNVVVPVSNVDGGVHLDATNFGPSQVLADINIVDIVIFNQGADTTEVPNDSSLPTIMNVVMPDNMGAHMLLIPALVGSLANSVPL